MHPKPDDPHWKTDFSVDWETTAEISRREFTRYLALGSLIMAAGSSLIALWGGLKRPARAPRMPVADLGAIAPGGTLVFEYPERGQYAILVHHADGRLDAFSQKCTHLGCSVFYGEKSGQLECPCHEGFFDARSGAVLAGPPQRPLPRIALEVVAGKIYAVGGGEA